MRVSRLFARPFGSMRSASVRASGAISWCIGIYSGNSGCLPVLEVSPFPCPASFSPCPHSAFRPSTVRNPLGFFTALNPKCFQEMPKPPGPRSLNSNSKVRRWLHPGMPGVLHSPFSSWHPAKQAFCCMVYDSYIHIVYVSIAEHSIPQDGTKAAAGHWGGTWRQGPQIGIVAPQEAKAQTSICTRPCSVDQDCKPSRPV